MTTILAFLAILAAYVAPADLPKPRQIDCIARTIYHEARGESVLGQIAVANVVMNRARSVDKTPCFIVAQRYQFATVGRITDKQAWADAVEIAALVHVGFINDQTDGATHFVRADVADRLRWFHGYQRALIIDDHVFFVPGEGGERIELAELREVRK
jgi:spore germination cell wall hydrolase CwlJ-like protein